MLRTAVFVAVSLIVTSGSCAQAHGGLIDSLFGDDPALQSLCDQMWDHDDWEATVGGGLRYRYMDERDRLRPQGNVRRHNYDLWRFTPFAQIGNEWVTGYVQAIDASIFNEDLPGVPIDENRADLLQYHLDFDLTEAVGVPLHFRYGRQFLKYGSEHLVSPLPWANTFRNFEGFRFYHESDSLAIDAFAVQPVNGATGNRFRPESFDTPDQSVWFSGVYATWKQAPGGTLDLYWLFLSEEEARLALHDGRRHTIGARYAGKFVSKDCCENPLQTWFWDVEGAWQVGEDDFQNGGVNQRVNAGFFSAIGGITLDDVVWTPTLQGLFWWGSGDSDPNDGTINTVTTLYPLGHAYWGIIDNFNGANLLDYSVQASVKPMEKLKLLAAWHWFDKASRNDAIYNIVGAPLGPLGGNRHLGNELDLIGTYTFSKTLSVELGYSWFWYGPAVTRTPLSRADAHQLYFMTTWGF